MWREGVRAYVQHVELTVLASGKQSVLDEIRIVQSVRISNPKFGDYVLTKSIGHFSSANLLRDATRIVGAIVP